MTEQKYKKERSMNKADRIYFNTKKNKEIEESLDQYIEDELKETDGDDEGSTVQE